ncbi:MAG TPA: energy transducer TonB [Candidatus Sulfotelmatobacter sp.]|nr:energy transducer TonB [Candidatus Sulfotelmatobacter sp.]
MRLLIISGQMLLATAFVLRCCSVAAADKRSDGAELLAKAVTLQDIRAADAKPFHLRLRIHTQGIVAKPADGTYDEVWLGPNKWRREISFPGFTQVVVGDQNSAWLSRNLDFRPRLAYLITLAIDRFIHPELLPKEAVGSVRERKKKGEALRCAELRLSSVVDRQVCFDQSGVLVSDEGESQYPDFEYSDYANFEGRVFPRSIHVNESGREVLSMTADDPSVPHDTSPQLFEHDPGAVQIAPCEQLPSNLVKKVPPHYPEDARHNGQRGTVILYVFLSADGQVGRVRVLQGVSPSLDQATIEAVRQWEYVPVKCGTAPLPTEVEVRVNYELR